MILSFVSDGLGVSLSTYEVAKKFQSRNSIKIIKLNEQVDITIALAIPKDTNLDPTIRAFKKYTLEWFKE